MWGTKSKVFRAAKLSAVVLAGLALAGCQSKNPMDYLPQSSGGFMGMNMVSMKESAGLKRLGEEMSKMQGAPSELESDKAQKVYIGFEMPGNSKEAPPMFGVALGTPGFADEVVGKYKAASATEGKTSGHTTYTSGPMTMTPIGETGILFFQDTAMLNKMIAVSKKKEPGARASSEFNYVDSQLADHAMAIAVKAEPLQTMAAPFLGQVSAMNPAGAEAIKLITMISVAFNWDDHPVVDLQLHLADKQKADALAGMINGYLTMAKGMPQLTASPQIAQIVQPLAAAGTEEGVTLKIDIPADVAEQMFGQLNALQQQRQFGMQPGMPGAAGMPGAMPTGAMPTAAPGAPTE